MVKTKTVNKCSITQKTLVKAPKKLVICENNRLLALEFEYNILKEGEKVNTSLGTKYCVNKKVFNENVKKIYWEFRKGLKGDYKIPRLSNFTFKVRRMSHRNGTAHINPWNPKIIIAFHRLESYNSLKKTLIHEFGHFAVGHQADGWHGRKFRMLMVRFGLVTLKGGHTITIEEEKERKVWIDNYEQRKKAEEKQLMRRSTIYEKEEVKVK